MKYFLNMFQLFLFDFRSHVYEAVNPKVSKTAVYSDSRHHIAREEEFDGITDEEVRYLT